MKAYPAWICRLQCGRWVVVTNEAEAHRSYYIDRTYFDRIIDARAAAYMKNHKKFGHTIYTVSDPKPL